MTTTLDNLEHLAGNSAPQAGLNAPRARTEPTLHISVTLEVILYVLIAVLALVLHLAQLGAAPLGDEEAAQALAALRTLDPDVPGDAPVAESPLIFALHAISFTFGGASNTAARLPVALGAVLLVLAPVLWRRYLNPLPPLIASGLLLISPVVLLAGHTSSPVIWSGLLALVVPWCVLRVVETRGRSYAIAATVGTVALVLLAEPAGLLMLLGLVFGVFFAWATDDDPSTDLLVAARGVARHWPWTDAGVAVALAVFIVGTAFFFLPSGLTAVGNVVWDGLRGFSVRPANHPLAFPLWVSLRYEPALILFGVLATLRAVREGGLFERTLAGWFLASLVLSVVYAGASAAHALWLTLPLVALVSLQVTGWLVERTSQYWRVPSWAVALQATVTAGLWMMFGMSVILLGKRMLLELPAQSTDLGALLKALTRGVYSRSTIDPGTVELQGGLVFDYVLGFMQFRLLVSVMLLLLIGVLFFMVGSLWSARVAWRGFALGTLAVLLLFGFGLGGRAAYDQYDDPRELWFRAPVTDDLHELSATLGEYSLRATGTPHLMRVAAQVDPNGATAWALRSFDNTQFVDGVGPEVSATAVVMPKATLEPVFGADYVGKDVVTRNAWTRRGTNGGSLPAWRYGLMWLYRSASLDQPVASETLMIWIRTDVYGVEQVN